MSQLDRFKQAQDQPHAGFTTALAEMRAGRKREHWIWYIFPQLAGLGTSSTAQTYGLADLAEATDYLRDPVLRGRLLNISNTVAERLREGVSLTTLMGAKIDALKLISSLTLFGEAARRLETGASGDEYRLLADVAEEILRAAESQGYQRCGYTLEQLRS